jgi:hypothetical protein
MDSRLAALLHRRQPHVRPVQCLDNTASIINLLLHSRAAMMGKQRLQECPCRSVLAMRAPAHERGAEIRPVRVHVQSGSCILHCCDDSAHCIIEDSAQGRTEQDSIASRSTRIMVAIPLECNLTGTRCSDKALDALCHGRVVVRNVSQAVSSFTLNPSSLHQLSIAPPSSVRAPLYYYSMYSTTPFLMVASMTAEFVSFQATSSYS